MEADGVKIERRYGVYENGYSCWPCGDGRQTTSSLEAHDTGHHAKLLL